MENRGLIALTENGRNLIKSRRERILGSQMSAGRLADIHQVTINDWESGRYRPTQEKFERYLRSLKLNPKEFIGDRRLCESVLLSRYPNKRKIKTVFASEYAPSNKDYNIFLTEEGRKYLKGMRIDKFGPQISASTALNFDQSTISNWESGRSNPPLQRFKEYLKALGSSHETYLRNGRYASVSKQTTLEKANSAASILNRKRISLQRGLSPEKAYILGTAGPGDGYVGYDELELKVIDKEFAAYFASCIRKVYGVDCKIIKIMPKRKGQSVSFSVRLTRKSAVEDVRKYARHWKEGDWEMPEKIKNARMKIKSAYLRAIFDSQSHVSVKKKEIVMYLSNLNGLKEIKRLLGTMRIESSVSDHTNILRISRRENVERFSEKIGYVINRKRTALKRFLGSYKQPAVLPCTRRKCAGALMGRWWRRF
jgi:transcriptional regulator with XRE-family HTH domain